MITPQQIEFRGWTAVRALPYLDASAKDQMREAVKTYMAGLDKQLDATPFGVPPSLGTWGGSGAVVDMAIRMYFLHKAFPDLVSPDYTLRAVNYVLGTHPVSSTSYVAGVNSFSRRTDEGNLLALHPTIKPVALVADAIMDCTSRRDIVLDPFLGSGTTVIAAERTGRTCYGIELDPLYVDTLIRRWQKFTGLSATHAASGRSFDELEKEVAHEQR
jgi:hypothetical protein